MNIFDFHTHFLDIRNLDGELADLAEKWRMRAAISCLGLNGRLLAEPSLDAVQRCNDKVAAWSAKYPQVFYPFCYINPKHGLNAVREIRRCRRVHRMKGVKLWIACRCSDRRLRPVIEEAAALNLPVLQHAYARTSRNLPGESYPEDVAELSVKYPQAKIIMAHMGFDWQRGVDAVKPCRNVAVDTSGFDPESGSVEYAVRQLGAGRVIYGSDAPGRDILCQIGKVVSANISEVDRTRIFFRNAESLLPKDDY